MTALRMRILIAVVAALLITAGIILFTTLPSPSKPYEPTPTYSERYASTVLNINAGVGVYRERDYYVSTSSQLTTPTNGEILINPIQLPQSEESIPGVQQSTYLIENTGTETLYTRLTNSKRSEERAGEAPEVAVVALEYANALEGSSWHQLNLYNVGNTDELVDSALLFTPSPTALSTDWQNKFSLFLVDGALTNHAAAILPGVNILNTTDDEGYATGTIYTNRSLAIGGLPSTQQDRPALEALEEAHGTGTLQNTEDLRRDTSQRITGTDLMFCAPKGKEVLSSIQAPASASGQSNALTVEGGVIAVDKGATLVIGSGEVGGKDSYLGGSRAKTASEGTVELSPRAIVVDGGRLVLSDTGTGGITLNTNIQVRNGGALKIGENVVINGNIFVFGGGSVEVLGNFALNGTPIAWAQGAALTDTADSSSIASEATEQVPGGIYILADNSLQTDGTSLGTGYFNASRLWMINGSDGVDPILMSRIVHFLSTEGRLDYLLMYNNYCCLDAQESTCICAHLGSVKDAEAPGVKVGFSEDRALVEVFASTEKGILGG